MSDVDVKDFTATSAKTIKAELISGKYYPAKIGYEPDGIALLGGETLAVASANFTRPADTTPYTSGDLVANSVTAGSVLPMSFTVTRAAARGLRVVRARLKKTNTTVTNGSFRLHLYGSDPSASTGITNGDNAAWLTKIAGYLGSIDIDLSGSTGRVFSDASAGQGSPAVGTEIIHKLSSGSVIYGLLEARGAYTPTSAEVFTVELEVAQK